MNQDNWEGKEREAWEEESKCYDIAGSVRPIVTDYWIERIREAREEERIAKIPEHSQAIEAIVSASRTAAIEEAIEIVKGIFPDWLDDVKTSQEIPENPYDAADEAMASIKSKVLAALSALVNKPQ